MKKDIILEADLSLYSSSADEIREIIGDIGIISGEEYIIVEGKYEIDIDLDKMIKLTLNHDIGVEIHNGVIFLR